MKKIHRSAHRLIWLLLLPLLVLIVIKAQTGRFAIEEKYEPSQLPVQGEKLP